MVLGVQGQSQLLEQLQNLLWKHLILRGQDMPSRLQLKRCIFCSRVLSLCAVWAWSCCQLRTVRNTGWTTAVYILGCCSWIPTLCPSACALSSLWWVPSVKRPTKRIAWRFALDQVNYEMSNFQLAQPLLPWSICCVETKIEEKAWQPLWTTDPKLRNLAMNGFAVLVNKCAEKEANVSRQLAVHSPVRMRLGRISWLERGSSANEVIVLNTVHN